MTQSQLGNSIQSILTMVDLFMVTKANLMKKLLIKDVTTTETEIKIEIKTEIKIATVNLIEEVLTEILLEETTNSGEMMAVTDGTKEDLRKTETIDHLREVES